MKAVAAAFNISINISNISLLVFCLKMFKFVPGRV